MTDKPFDPTKPVQTRDGRKARIICTDAASPLPIVALVTDKGVEYPTVFTKEGRVGSYRNCPI